MTKVYTHDSDWASLREKIEASLDTESHPGGCWIWTGGKDARGYGIVRWAGKAVKVHRSYLKELGRDVPDGLVTDHLCSNPPCSNPGHLEVVTQGENVRRGKRARQTHCIHGHEFDTENTYINPISGSRMCKACGKERRKRYRAQGKPW